jgi:hypothetical protein
MSFARVTIEQTGPMRWIAEVELGGSTARREVIRAQTWGGVLEGVQAAYDRLTVYMNPKHMAPKPTATEPGEITEPTAIDVAEFVRRGPGRPRKAE